MFQKNLDKHKSKQYEFQRGLCCWCGRLMNQPLKIGNQGSLSPTWEHIIPRSRKGPDSLVNKVLAHKKCNEKRGAVLNEMPKFISYLHYYPAHHESRDTFEKKLIKLFGTQPKIGLYDIPERLRSLAEGSKKPGRQQTSTLHDAGSNPAGVSNILDGVEYFHVMTRDQSM